MAAPHVAGLIALMLSKNPDISPEQIDSILETTALDLGTSGKDNNYGAGRIQCSLAIANVPAPPYPIIYHYSHSINDIPPGTNDNGVLDPGETADLVVTLQNQGADGEGIIATLTENSPYVSIAVDSTDYGNIATLEAKTNSSAPFNITAHPGTPENILIPFELHITDDNGYSNVDTIEIGVANYIRALANHDNEYIKTSITNFGSIGFFAPESDEPYGYGFTINSVNYLFGGGLFLGIDYHNVIGGKFGNESEWHPAGIIQTDAKSGGGKQIKTCAFTTPDHSVIVKQTSYSFPDDNNNDYLLLRYEIQNPSDTNLSNIYCGTYCDWDININPYSGAWSDKAEFNPSDGIAYMFDSSPSSSSPKYVGIAKIDSNDRGSIVKNPAHVYASGNGMGWDDTVKYNFLSGKFYLQTGPNGNDWSTIICKGPFDIPARAKINFSCAIVSGDNYSSLAANATAARAAHDTLHETIPNHSLYHHLTQPTRLLANTPNPFTKQTSINYSLATPTDVNITISALNGQTVLAENFSNQANGAHAFLWDGKDAHGANVNTGIYLVALTTSNCQRRTKMLLIR